jgi:subtilisin family serine protease
MSWSQQLGLAPLMRLTSGHRGLVIGLIDGPVEVDHRALVGAAIRELGAEQPGTSSRGSAFRGRGCQRRDSVACAHGTFVAGMLAARRGSAAPAICPGCTFLVRPIFGETATGPDHMPVATPGELAAAIIDCVKAGARLLNLSVGMAGAAGRDARVLGEALDAAARRGVVTVAAAGNQAMVGSSAITAHPGVIPVVGCDRQGRPLGLSNLGSSIGARGLCALGDKIVGLLPQGPSASLSGTSVAAPFVTGAAALLWSLYPDASSPRLRHALLRPRGGRSRAIVPPLLDAWASYQALLPRGLARGRRAIVTAGGDEAP